MMKALRRVDDEGFMKGRWRRLYEGSMAKALRRVNAKGFDKG